MANLLTYLLTQTTQPTCQGDAAGIGGGIKSGTVGKEVKPAKGASNIFVEGKSLIREGDPCTMNNDNTKGKYIALVPATNQTSAASSLFLQSLPFVAGGQTISKALGNISTPAQANNTTKQGQLLQTAMSFANLIPNPKVSQGLGMLNSGMQTAQALKQGNLLGGAMSAASLIPNQKVATGLRVLNTGLQIGQQLSQGAILDAGMSIAGLIPGSENLLNFASLGKQILEELKPEPILIKNFAPDDQTLQAPPKSIGGTIIKGQGISLACQSCPSAQPAVMNGSPVNALYGSKILSGNEDVDCIGRGYLSFGLVRIYNSQNDRIGWFGQGWQSQGYEQRLTLNPQHNRIYLNDNAGRNIPFFYLEPGEYCYQPHEDLTLYRLSNESMTSSDLNDNAKNYQTDSKSPTSKPILADAVQGARIGDDEKLSFILFTGNYQPPANFGLDNPAHTFTGTALYFNHVHQRNALGIKAIVLASGIFDNRGHKLQLHYTHDKYGSMAHLPQYITDDAGDCYQLTFTLINDKPRLTGLHLIIDGKNTKPLFHYDYSPQGDLIKVAEQGRTVREFGYTDHLMTWQKLPDGQNAYYRYDQTRQAKTARVIDHWLDNGQTYHFDYHTDKQGIHRSTVTEQAGTQLERQRHYEYNDDYFLTAFTNPSGHKTTYQYEDLNRITKITSPNGSHTLIQYQGNLLHSIAVQVGVSPLTGLPIYRETHYQYDKKGNLTSIMDALGNQRKFNYNEHHDVIKSTDALANETQFDYDKHGNLIRQTLANGSHYCFDYNELGQLIAQTDCSHNTTHYHYDEMGRVIQVVDAMGHKTSYYYDQAILADDTSQAARQSLDQSSEQSLQNRQLTTALTQAVYSDGHKEQFIYDSHNRLIEYRDGAGLATHYRYTQDGLPSKRVSANGATLSYQYDALRRLTKLTNENGEHWDFYYNKADNLIKEVRFDGHTTHYTYDKTGNLIHQTDNNETKKEQRFKRHIYLERDLIGQITHKHCLDYTYDEYAKSGSYLNPFGQPISRHDFAPSHASPTRLRHTTCFQYDITGRLIKAISPDATIVLDYDAAGHVIKETLLRHHPDNILSKSLTDADNNSSLKNKDTNQGVDESDNPLLEQRITHSYDSLGNHITTTLPDGSVINHLYYGSHHLYNQSMAYKEDGQIKHLELRHSERDHLHRETLRQQGKLTTTFDYDPMGRLTKQQSQYHEGIIIERGYHYDPMGQLIHMTGKSELYHQANPPNRIIHQTFDRNHQYRYDKVGRLIEHKLTDFSRQTGIQEQFAFDPASNRVPLLSKSDGSANGLSKDNVMSQGSGLQKVDEQTKRPAKLISQGKQISYFYDRHGRIKTKTAVPVDNQGQPIPQSVNGLAGLRESLQLFYNPNNELNKSITIQDEGTKLTTTTTRYYYDAFGRRIAKSSRVKTAYRQGLTGNTPKFGLVSHDKPKRHTTLMLWDGNRQIQQYTDTHIFTTIYEQNSFVPVARVVQLQPHLLPSEQESHQSYLNQYKDTHLSQTDKQHLKDKDPNQLKVYYYHNNHLGTPQELTDESGDVIWLSYDYVWGGSFDTI